MTRVDGEPRARSALQIVPGSASLVDFGVKVQDCLVARCELRRVVEDRPGFRNEARIERCPRLLVAQRRVAGISRRGLAIVGGRFRKPPRHRFQIPQPFPDPPIGGDPRQQRLDDRDRAPNVPPTHVELCGAHLRCDRIAPILCRHGPLIAPLS